LWASLLLTTYLIDLQSIHVLFAFIVATITWFAPGLSGNERGPNRYGQGPSLAQSYHQLMRRMGEGLGAGGTPSGIGLTPNPEVCSA
jgi:hypothetical protein